MDGYGSTEWVGIEWDDKGRGKHNGTLNGKFYFSCSSERGASFVKRDKLGDGGRRSFQEAVDARYRPDGEARSGVVGSIGRASVALVGMEELGERQGKRDELRSISLRAAGVCRVSLDVSLEKMLPVVEELDLRECLISDFQTLYDIASGLPTLRLLDLSRNRFSHARSLSPRKPDRACSSLQTLILNETNVSWADCLLFGSLFTSLKELRLHAVGLRDLGESEMFEASKALSNVEIMDLDSNFLSWSSIELLSTLPRLTHLFVSNNKVAQIRLNNTPGLRCFASLKHLNLSRNLLSDWTSVTQLERLPNLASLRMSGNPLTSNADEATDVDARTTGIPRSRLGVIARIPQLSVLDGSQISADERRYAEKQYLQSILADHPDLRDVTVKHPLFESLCKAYEINLEEVRSKAEIRSRQVRKPRTTLAADLIRLRLVNVDLNPDARSAIIKRLPRSTSINKVRGLFGRLFRIPSSVRISLHLVRVPTDDEQSTRDSVEMDNDMRVLRDYGASNGCWIEASRI